MFSSGVFRVLHGMNRPTTYSIANKRQIYHSFPSEMAIVQRESIFVSFERGNVDTDGSYRENRAGSVIDTLKPLRENWFPECQNPSIARVLIA